MSVTQNTYGYPKFKAFIAGTGNPLVGGQLYTIIPGGSIGQYKTSYTDANGTANNTNPVILDANGECSLWGTGYYKFILQDANSVQLWSIDNVNLGTISSSVSSGQWIVSGLVPTYISATQFSFAGDQRSIFQSGLRLQITETAGTVYGTVTAVSYGAGITTVTFVGDTNPVDSGISVVNYGIITISANTTSLPILPVIVQSSNYSFVTTDAGQTYEFKANLSNTSCTVSNASPGVVTCANNGLAIGSQFIFGLGANGALPANVSANTIYYPITTGFVANTSFQFSNSNGGSAINTTGITSSNVTISQCLTGALPTANTFPSNGTLEIKDVSAGLVTISGTIDGNANGITLTSLGYTKIYSDSNSWYTKLPQIANITAGQLVYDSSNASLPATSITIPGLTGLAHGGYKFEATYVNANANNNLYISMYFNNDQANANYSYSINNSGATGGYICLLSATGTPANNASTFTGIIGLYPASANTYFLRTQGITETTAIANNAFVAYYIDNASVFSYCI